MAVVHQTAPLMTDEDVLRLPDDGNRYELIEGVLLTMSPAGRLHNLVWSRIYRPLADFVEEHGLGEAYAADMGFILQRDPYTMLCPDVAFVSSERLVDQDEQGFLALTPNLAVEVISPSNTVREMNDKVFAYLGAGTQLVFVCDPVKRVVIVWTPDRIARVVGDTETLDFGPIVPGFKIAVADVFR